MKLLLISWLVGMALPYANCAEDLGRKVQVVGGNHERGWDSEFAENETIAEGVFQMFRYWDMMPLGQEMEMDLVYFSDQDAQDYCKYWGDFLHDRLDMAALEQSSFFQRAQGKLVWLLASMSTSTWWNACEHFQDDWSIIVAPCVIFRGSVLFTYRDERYSQFLTNRHDGSRLENLRNELMSTLDRYNITERTCNTMGVVITDGLARARTMLKEDPGSSLRLRFQIFPSIYNSFYDSPLIHFLFRFVFGMMMLFLTCHSAYLFNRRRKLWSRKRKIRPGPFEVCLATNFVLTAILAIIFFIDGYGGVNSVFSQVVIDCTRFMFLGCHSGSDLLIASLFGEAVKKLSFSSDLSPPRLTKPIRGLAVCLIVGDIWVSIAALTEVVGVTFLLYAAVVFALVQLIVLIYLVWATVKVIRTIRAFNDLVENQKATATANLVRRLTYWLRISIFSSGISLSIYALGGLRILYFNGPVEYFTLTGVAIFFRSLSILAQNMYCKNNEQQKRALSRRKMGEIVPVLQTVVSKVNTSFVRVAENVQRIVTID